MLRLIILVKSSNIMTNEFTSRTDIFSAELVKTVNTLGDDLLEALYDCDVMDISNVLNKDFALIRIAETACEYCSSQKEMEREHIDLLVVLYNIFSFIGDFETSQKYAKQGVEVAKKSEVMEYIAEAYFLCTNATISCALGVASSVLEKATEDDDNSVPEYIEDKAIEFINEIVDSSHEAFILYIKLALEAAVSLGLVEESLKDKTDEESIVNTVTTLSEAIEKVEKTEEVMNIVNFLQIAVEMNETVGLID